MLKRIYTSAVIGLVLIGLMGCVEFRWRPLSPAQSIPVSELSYATFIAALRADGAKVVAPVDDVERDFFEPMGTVILVNDEYVEVFEFSGIEEMEAAASTVGADGRTFRTMIVEWASEPHFFKSGRIIVLYIGTNSVIERHLRNVLGPQFAGD